jgi:hypothetical protein
MNDAALAGLRAPNLKEFALADVSASLDLMVGCHKSRHGIAGPCRGINRAVRSARL